MVRLTIPAVGVPVSRKNIVSSLQAVVVVPLEFGGSMRELNDSKFDEALESQLEPVHT